jgi:hypothetical protein
LENLSALFLMSLQLPMGLSQILCLPIQIEGKAHVVVL